MDDGIAGIIFVILILFSGLFSALDTALASLSPLKVKKLEKEGDKRATTILGLIADRQRVIITLLIGNTFCNVSVISIIAGVIDTQFSSPEYWTWTGITSQVVAEVVLTAIIMTAVLVIFGEIIPKIVAIYGGYTFVAWTHRILRVFMFISYPVVGIVVWFIKKLSPKYSDWNNHISGSSSLEEIDNYFDLGEEVGLIEEDEKELITSVFEFGDTMVREVMIPRPDISAIPINTSFKDLLAHIQNDGLSRFPVYDGSIDKIVGILYVKDILIRLEEIENSYDLFHLLRPPFFVPETKKLDDLLTEFKKRKQHLAMVIDEYGGVSGLVTIEDLLEEIVGEIDDEYDVDELKSLAKVDENVYSIDARLCISDLEDQLGCQFDCKDSDTVGGYVLEKMGRIPQRGDSFKVSKGNFQITEIKGNRILRVKFTMDVDSKEQSVEDN